MVDLLGLIVVCVVCRTLDDVEGEPFLFVPPFIICYDFSCFVMLTHQ